MRTHVVAAGGILLLTGCLGSQTTTCDSGVVCPASYACAPAPALCGRTEDVAACDGQPDGATCSSSLTPSGSCASGVCSPCRPELLGCRHDGWTAMTPVTSATLTDVWAISAREVYAVGDQGALVHYDGARWELLDTPTSASLTSVWAHPGDSDAPEATVLFVATIDGHVFRRDDGAWEQMNVPEPVLRIDALWGAAPDQVFAVGVRALGFDGAAWRELDVGTREPLEGIDGRGPADVYAVGYRGVVQHFAGSWPVAETRAAPNVGALSDVWLSPGEGVYAVGRTNMGASLILHGTGPAAPWTAMPLPELPLQTALLEIGGTGDGLVVAVGTEGTILHLEGDAWVVQPAPGAVRLNAVAGTATGDVFAVGAAGAIWRYRAD